MKISQKSSFENEIFLMSRIFSYILISKMNKKMNLKIITKNHADDWKIGSPLKIDFRADRTHQSNPTAWDLIMNQLIIFSYKLSKKMTIYFYKNYYSKKLILVRQPKRIRAGRIKLSSPLDFCCKWLPIIPDLFFVKGNKRATSQFIHQSFKK